MLCIGYLADERRTYSFKQFVYFLNKCINIKKIHLLLLINNIEKNFFIDILKTDGININYSIEKFPSSNNYINKINYLIQFSKKNNNYCFKLDNDIIINNYTLDYITENLNLLENKENLFMSPNLSSGIPSCDNFITNFFDKEEQKSIYDIFLRTNFPSDLWGFDYSFLNKFTINSKEWNYENYKSSLKDCNYHYKGIHPIRINKEAILYLNELIIKKKEEIFKKQDYSLNITTDFPYFCNSAFIIKPEVYENIVSNKDLYVDPYDEVPVNKYCKLNNLKGIFIENTFTIHPIYNSISNHTIHEKIFFENFFN